MKQPVWLTFVLSQMRAVAGDMRFAEPLADNALGPAARGLRSELGVLRPAYDESNGLDGFGEREAEDAVWSYQEPLPECPRIKGHLCFYPEKIESLGIEGEGPHVPTRQTA